MKSRSMTATGGQAAEATEAAEAAETADHRLKRLFCQQSCHYAHLLFWCLHKLHGLWSSPRWQVFFQTFTFIYFTSGTPRRTEGHVIHTKPLKGDISFWKHPKHRCRCCSCSVCCSLNAAIDDVTYARHQLHLGMSQGTLAQGYGISHYHGN